MTHPTPNIKVAVDITNPGQFFACCGLLELVGRLPSVSAPEGWFMDDTFYVSAGDDSGVFDRVFKTLRDTPIEDDKTVADAAIRPVCLRDFGIRLDWWLGDSGKKTVLKLWAGQQTGLKIVKDLREALGDSAHATPEDLFVRASPMTGRFGVDPRAAWEALDVGFSPNRQKMKVQTFPAVELLAAVGIQGFRPPQEKRVLGRKTVWFRYTTWSAPLPLCVARAASTGILPSVVTKTFSFRVAERGSYKGFDYAISKGDET